jgi:hypothetical protein
MLLGPADVTEKHKITFIRSGKNKGKQYFEVNFEAGDFSNGYTDVVQLSEKEMHQALTDYFEKRRKQWERE